MRCDEPRQERRHRYAGYLASPQIRARVTLGVDNESTAVAEVDDAYLGDRSEIMTITRSELQEPLQSGKTTLVDVPPMAEYDAGNIPGAIAVQPDQLDELLPQLPQLPTDREIVAHCRGPYCVCADQAVRTLVTTGRSARRLEDGLPEWQRSGGRVETSSTHNRSTT